MLFVPMVLVVVVISVANTTSRDILDGLSGHLFNSTVLVVTDTLFDL